MGTLDELRLFSETYFSAGNCCYGKNDSPQNSEATSMRRGLTDFSINEIMKPDFGYRSSDYEEDCQSSVSQSSAEEYTAKIVPFTAPYPANVSKMLLMRFIEQSRQLCHADDSSDCSKSPSPAPSGYSVGTPSHISTTSGSASSDEESALDLRIRRKKTPPSQRMPTIPAWVFCTRYSDRPSAGPRSRRRKATKPTGSTSKRPRTAFNSAQLEQLQIEFETCAYLSEERRQRLAETLDLNECRVKIWFQNRRAKVKKNAVPRPLALRLKADGLYNHKPRSDNETGYIDF